MQVAGVKERSVVALSDARIAGAAMLAVAAVQPLLPGSPGLPCPLRALTGIPCPLCGMTTSVIAAVQLRLGDAVAANPAGIVAVVAAVVLLVAWRRERLMVTIPKWVLPAILAAMWVFQLFRFSIV